MTYDCYQLSRMFSSEFSGVRFYKIKFTFAKVEVTLTGLFSSRHRVRMWHSVAGETM